MSGKSWSGGDATKGVMRFGNYFDSSRRIGGGRGSQSWGTGYSNMSYGNVTLDPSIRALQEEGLANIRKLYGDTETYGNELIGNTRGLRERYLGNESAYKQSLINPILAQVAQRRGELQRNIGTRGLSGSSFGDQAMTNFDTDSQRALQDARAQAEFSNLQALTGIDSQLMQQMFGKISTQASLNGMTLEQAKQRLAQELSALGLGTQQQQLMIQAFESQQNRSEKERNDIANAVLRGFGMGGGGGTTPTLGGTGGGGGGSTSSSPFAQWM